MKMTAPRLVATRASRRFFAGLGCLILMVCFVAIFHSSQQQLDELRQLGLRCEQQQEAISAQMQMVVDQKLRLENSLASERMINDQNKQELKIKAKEEKELHSKSSMESNLRYASLQQHYKLMKSQLDDLTAECLKSKKQHMEEANSMQAKLSSLHGQVIQADHEAQNKIEYLKLQYTQLQAEKIILEKQLLKKIDEKDEMINKLKYQNFHIQKENDRYIEICNANPDQMPKHVKTEDVVDEPPKPAAHEKSERRNFNEQISVSPDMYKIALITNQNNTNHNHVEGLQQPNNNLKITNNKNGDGIINSVENFQIIPKPLPLNSDEQNNKNKNNANVLQQPTLIRTSTSITYEVNIKTSEKGSNLQVPILPAPTIVPDDEQVKAKTSSTTTTTTKKATGKVKSKAVPVGVVPIPENMNDLMKADENNSDNGVNNRYSNALQSNANGKKDEKDHKDINFLNGNGEQENGANEVHDNDFNIAHNNKENNLPNDNLNAAEEDTNLYDNNVNNKLFGNAGSKDYIDIQHQHKAGNNNNIGKLNNEIVGDHGKEGDNYPNEMEEDLHLDGQAEAEEEGDVGEYDDPKAMKQGHAERN